MASNLINHFKEEMTMKSKVAIVVGLLVLILLVPTIYFFASVPRADIDALEQGYVSIKLEGDEVLYTVVSKRPGTWRSINQISNHAKNAIVVSEDWAFFQHEGVDTDQLKKAIEDHFTKDKKLRGASTISQQLVKNLFLSNERSFSRKIKEFFITKYLESRLTKDKILEIYLNIIQYGDKLYGIEPASRYYFKKGASDLNPNEAAFLAMLLPNPVKYSQSFRDKELTDFASKTVSDILVKMKQAKMISDNQFEQASGRGISWDKSKKSSPSKLGAKGRAREGLQDGRDYEDASMSDPDLKVKDLNYDDDAMVEDLSGLESEFQVED